MSSEAAKQASEQLAADRAGLNRFGLDRAGPNRGQVVTGGLPVDTAGLISPRHGPCVCPDCLDLMEPGRDRCFTCRARPSSQLAVMTPIAYSVGGERLHREIAAYKRDADPFVKAAAEHLARLLDQFLELHEDCVAVAAGVERFSLVTTVPSLQPRPGARHPLERIVGELVPTTVARYERVLRRSARPARAREFDPHRYEITIGRPYGLAGDRPLAGETILLIDDMWTTGASAQSAAAALRAGGAACVAAVVIGRHVNREWYENGRRLRQRAVSPFDPARCTLCAEREIAGLDLIRRTPGQPEPGP